MWYIINHGYWSYKPTQPKTYMKLWTCLPYPKPQVSRLHPIRGNTSTKSFGPAEPSRAANHLAGHHHPGFAAPSAHGFPTLGYVSAVGARGTELEVLGGFKSTPKKYSATSHLSQSYLKYGWKQWIFLTSPDNVWTYIQHVWTTRHLKYNGPSVKTC
jgi:hypothetical protein